MGHPQGCFRSQFCPARALHGRGKNAGLRLMRGRHGATGAAPTVAQSRGGHPASRSIGTCGLALPHVSTSRVASGSPHRVARKAWRGTSVVRTRVAARLTARKRPPRDDARLRRRKKSLSAKGSPSAPRSRLIAGPRGHANAALTPNRPRVPRHRPNHARLDLRRLWLGPSEARSWRRQI